MAGDLERKAALLGTKYSKPGINPNLVTRQRLHDKLNESLKNKLTTVVAPAGYGKTTAVLEWLGGISKDAEYVFSSLDLLKANVHINILVDRLSEVPSDFIFVLDDLHLINEPSILEGLFYLIDYLPPNMHLIIISRTEPDMMLPRQRIKWQDS